MYTNLSLSFFDILLWSGSDLQLREFKRANQRAPEDTVNSRSVWAVVAVYAVHTDSATRVGPPAAILAHSTINTRQLVIVTVIRRYRQADMNRLRVSCAA